MKIEDVYSPEEARSLMPFGAELLYHVTVGVYGFVHDTGTVITLTPIRNGEEPTGWETFDRDLTEAVDRVKTMWKAWSSFGYH